MLNSRRMPTHYHFICMYIAFEFHFIFQYLLYFPLEQRLFFVLPQLRFPILLLTCLSFLNLSGMSNEMPLISASSYHEKRYWLLRFHHIRIFCTVCNTMSFLCCFLYNRNGYIDNHFPISSITDTHNNYHCL